MNALYDSGRESFLDGQISWTQNTIRVALVDTANYAVNLSTDTWLSDIPSAAKVAISSPLSSKTVVGGIAGADSAVFASVTGPTCEALVVYRDTGVSTTSRLIAYISSANGLPVNPTGSSITVAWDTDSSKKIFKL